MLVMITLVKMFSDEDQIGRQIPVTNLQFNSFDVLMVTGCTGTILKVYFIYMYIPVLAKGFCC